MSNMTEEQKLAAFSDFTNADWQRKQQEMSTETRVPMQGTRPNKKANVPEGEPPHGYVCYRCNKKGKHAHHQIANLTNNMQATGSRHVLPTMMHLTTTRLASTERRAFPGQC